MNPKWKKIGLKTKITIKTHKKHLFIFNIYELWPHRHRSAMITASQFTAASLLSQTDGDFEPSVEVFQQWASYASGIEPEINQLVKGRKTRHAKTIDTCRGKTVTKKWGNLLFNRQNSWSVNNCWYSYKASDSWNQHAIYDTSAVIVWIAVSELQHSSKQKTLVVPAEKFRWSQSSWAHFIKQHKEKNLPQVLRIGRTFQAHQKTFVSCQKFRKCTDCYQKLETVSIKNYEKCRGTKLILHCHIVLKKAPNGVWTTIRLFDKVVPFQKKGNMLENCTETGKKIGT